MKVALYFGSFNPIHIGHLALGNYVCEYAGVDELWFVVSPRNPFKQNHQLMDDELRLRMVKVAISGYDRFRACDVEFSLPRPSYTYNTLQCLHQLYPDHTFIILMGGDNWQGFSGWFKAEEILSQHQILIYPRPAYPIDSKTLPEGVTLIHAPLMEISSTFIRRAFSEGKDVRYFLHPEIYKLLINEKS